MGDQESTIEDRHGLAFLDDEEASLLTAFCTAVVHGGGALIDFEGHPLLRQIFGKIATQLLERASEARDEAARAR